jgi:DNA replication protein DnaC
MMPPPPATARQQSYQLGPEQQAVLQVALSGHCMLLTGGAGVGKSYTVAALVQELRRHGRSVCLTASTGTAALHIGGMTLHRCVCECL